ncbi:M48 family metalloprotease [Pyrococcus kukulkanii]|uniref:M48 family metalloprotease n=1 Tax=Pyrococcus kukulkanii TaxID=1609559 RepID=UPI003561F7CC
MLKGYALSILPVVLITILLRIGDRLPEAILTICVVISFIILVAGLLYRLVKFNLNCELEADEFAAELVGADAMIKALKKLSEYEEIPMKTPKWFNVIYSHPSIEERIKNLRISQAKNEKAQNM